MEFDATFLIAVISFVVFVLVMNKIFYAPVLKITEERQRVVEANYRSAAASNEETGKKLAYRNDELAKTGEEARKTTSALVKQLKVEHVEAVCAHKTSVADEMTQMKNELKQSAYDAKEILKDKVVDIAGEISHILLGSDVDTSGINKDNADDTI